MRPNYLQKGPNQSYRCQVHLVLIWADGTCIQHSHFHSCQKWQKRRCEALCTVSSFRKLKYMQKLMGNYDERPLQSQEVLEIKEDSKRCAFGFRCLWYPKTMCQNGWEMRETSHHLSLCASSSWVMELWSLMCSNSSASIFSRARSKRTSLRRSWSQ